MDAQTFFAEAFKLMGQLPWQFIGGIASALIIGWFASRHSLKQQKLQLKFDADQQRIDRQVQMRREVYLEAASALVHMGACLGRSTNPSVTLDDFDRVAQDFNVQMSRAFLVASKEAIPAIAAAQRAYMTQFMQALRDRHPAVIRQQDIDLSLKSLSGRRQERQQCIDLMKAYHFDGVQDPKRWTAVREHVDFLSERIATENTTWQQLQQEQRRELSQLYAAVPQRAILLLEFQTAALVAIRSDLEQDGAADVLLEQMQMNVEAMKSTYTSTIRGLTAPTSDPALLPEPHTSEARLQVHAELAPFARTQG
jgi:hypothetical protein